MQLWAYPMSSCHSRLKELDWLFFKRIWGFVTLSNRSICWSSFQCFFNVHSFLPKINSVQTLRLIREGQSSNQPTDRPIIVRPKESRKEDNSVPAARSNLLNWWLPLLFKASYVVNQFSRPVIIVFLVLFFFTPSRWDDNQVTQGGVHRLAPPMGYNLQPVIQPISIQTMRVKFDPPNVVFSMGEKRESLHGCRVDPDDLTHKDMASCRSTLKCQTRYF